MKLALVSPMPPAASGVADYAAGLVEVLRRRVTVDVVDGVTAAYDNAIYQIGNNPLHWTAYRAAIEQPGVAVMHDAVLHHLLLGSLDEGGYVKEFVYNYGEWQRGLARLLWQGRSRSASDARYFEYPMLRRVVEASRAVVVHNPGARRMVEQAVVGARVVEIPHYFVPPRLPREARETRDRLGIKPHEVLIAAFGYLRESKRIASILKAVQGLRRARFLLVGRFVSEELERALEPRLESAGVIRRGYVPEDEFWRLAEAVDICVNLRWPTAGETSGIAIKMMGIGKPVLVTNSDEMAGLPESAVVRVDPGEAEIEMLAHYLRLLVDSEGMRRDIGRRAAAHIAKHHTLERAAAAYLEAVSRC